MKKYIIASLLICTVICSGYRKPDEYVIESEQNAYLHNNRGLIYIEERAYYPAIQEFKIAISLAPDVQASAVFYNNLGECYMKIGKPALARDCFERAVQIFSLNFKYYKNLAECYYVLGLADTQIGISSQDPNPLGLILRGLLYEQKGEISLAITTLDEFLIKEPDIIISSAVRQYLKELTAKVSP